MVLGSKEARKLTVYHRDLEYVVGPTTDTGTQCSKSDGRGLGNNRISDGTHRESVCERDNDTEARLRVVGGARLVDRSCNTECHKAADVERGTVEIDCSSAEICGQNKGETVCHKSEAGVDETELEREIGIHPGLCIGLAISVEAWCGAGLRSKKKVA